MPTTIYLPDETLTNLMDVKHELEKANKKDYAWHKVIDELIESYRNNH